MSKFVCNVCGYVHEGDSAPEVCPVCKVGSDKFTEQSGERTWAAEHVVGVAKGAPEDIIMDLRANFEGECSEAQTFSPSCLLNFSAPTLHTGHCSGALSPS